MDSILTINWEIVFFTRNLDSGLLGKDAILFNTKKDVFELLSKIFILKALLDELKLVTAEGTQDPYQSGMF